MITAFIFTIFSSVLGAHSMGDELSEAFHQDPNSILILPLISQKTERVTYAQRYHPRKINSKTRPISLLLQAKDVTSIKASWPDEGNENSKAFTSSFTGEKAMSKIADSDIVGLKISQSVRDKQQISIRQMQDLAIKIYSEVDIDDNSVISYNPNNVCAILVTNESQVKQLEWARKKFPSLPVVYHNIGGQPFTDQPPTQEADEPVAQPERTAPKVSDKKTKKEMKLRKIEDIKQTLGIKSDEIAAFVHEYQLLDVVREMSQCKPLIRDMGLANVESWLKHQYDEVRKTKNPISPAASSTYSVSPSHASNDAPKISSEVPSESSEGLPPLEDISFDLYLYILQDWDLATSVHAQYGPDLDEEQLQQIAINESVQRSKNDQDFTYIQDSEKALKNSMKGYDYAELEALEMAQERSLADPDLEMAMKMSLGESHQKFEDNIPRFSQSASSSSGNCSGLQFDISAILRNIGLDPEKFERLKLRQEESMHFKERIQQIYETLIGETDWDCFLEDDEDLTDMVFKIYTQWKDGEFDREMFATLMNDVTRDEGAEPMPQGNKRNKKRGKNKRKK